jgi:hypothetical protein
MDDIKIAQKSLRCFVYSTFTRCPFLSANIYIRRSTTTVINTKNCAFRNEKLAIYSILPEKLTPQAGDFMSVFQRVKFPLTWLVRLCKHYALNNI